MSEHQPVVGRRGLVYPLLAAGLVAVAGCAATGPSVTRLADVHLTEAASRQLAAAVALDDGAWLRVERLRLRPVAGTDRVRADFVAWIDTPGVGSHRHAGWAVDGRLLWQGSDCSLRLTQVEADLAPDLRVDDFAARQREIVMAAALSRRLEGLVLWSAADRPVSACSAGRVRTSSRAVEVQFGG